MLNRTLLNGVYIGRERNNNRGRRYIGDAIRWRTTMGGYPVTHSVWNINHRETWTPWETSNVLSGSRSIDELGLNVWEDEKSWESSLKRPYKARWSGVASKEDRHRDKLCATTSDLAAAAFTLRKIVELIKTEISFSQNQSRLHISRNIKEWEKH